MRLNDISKPGGEDLFLGTGNASSLFFVANGVKYFELTPAGVLKGVTGSGALLDLTADLLELADGTAAAPSLTFASDTDTGMYHISSDRVGFACNGFLQFDYNTSRLLLSSGFALTGTSSVLSGFTTGAFATSVTQGGALALGSTSTDGIVLQNTTASITGNAQISPRLRLSGTADNTTAGHVSETDSFILECLPATVAGATTGTLKFGWINAAQAVTYPCTISSAGDVASLSSFNTVSAGIFYWQSRSQLRSPASGQINFLASDGTTGAGIDTATASTMKFRVVAQNADAAIQFGSAVASGSITTAANGALLAPIVLTHGTVLSTPTVDALENDGVALYSTVDTTNGRRCDDNWNYFRLTGSGTGVGQSITDFFGTNDGIPLVANGVYEIEWHCYFSQATAGIATWTIVTATTALATLNAEYNGSNIAGIGTVGAPQTAAVVTTASSSTALPVTGTEATGATHYFVIHAMLTAGAGASNTRLRLTMSAGTATQLINSYFKVRRLPAANTGTFVA